MPYSGGDEENSDIGRRKALTLATSIAGFSTFPSSVAAKGTESGPLNTSIRFVEADLYHRDLPRGPYANNDPFGEYIINPNDNEMVVTQFLPDVAKENIKNNSVVINTRRDNMSAEDNFNISSRRAYRNPNCFLRLAEEYEKPRIKIFESDEAGKLHVRGVAEGEVDTASEKEFELPPQTISVKELSGEISTHEVTPRVRVRNYGTLNVSVANNWG